MAGRYRLEGIPAFAASKILTDDKLTPGILFIFLREDYCAVLAFAESQFERIGDAAALARTQYYPVNDQIDLYMTNAWLDGGGIIQIFYFTVHPHFLKPALFQAR